MEPPPKAQPSEPGRGTATASPTGAAAAGSGATGNKSGAAANPSPRTLRRAKLFWEQCQADLKEARALLKRKQPVRSSFLSLQGATNGLSALCHLQGHFQLPAGGPAQLLALFASGAPEFPGENLGFPALERVMEQQPFSAPQSGGDGGGGGAEFGKQCLAEAEALRKLLKRFLKANRNRYFAP